MGFTKKVEEAMNAQFTFELRSFYAYLAMSAHCENEKLPGFASWLRVQAKEELDHAMKFYSFIIDRGGRVAFDGIDSSPADFGAPLEVFRRALQNEEAVSTAINDLYALTIEERDYASQAFLNWFVTEQVEEEKVVGDVVDSLERIGSTGEALFLLDRELGGRPADGG